MDEQHKVDFLASAQLSIEEAARLAGDTVRDHVVELERLEAEYGLDVDAYLEIYGQAALDGRLEYAQHLLAVWSALYEGLAAEGHTLGIYTTIEKLAPGCYGFGKEAEYDYTESGVIAEGPATIEFRREEVDGKLRVSAVLVGTLMAAGFVDQRGEVTEVELVSNAPYSERMRNERPRLDGNTVVFNAPEGEDFYGAALDVEHQIYRGKSSLRYRSSRLASKYFDKYVSKVLSD